MSNKIGEFSLLSVLLLVAVASASKTNGEPECMSRFDHDYKVIQKLAMLEIEQKELRETLTSQKAIIKKLTDELAGMPRHNQVVAFSAQVSNNLVSLPAGTTVIFDHVTLNIGNAYDPKHGVFTAMHDGIYLFMTTLSSHKHSYLWIMKNGESLEYTFAPDSTWNTGTAAVTMQLTTRDRVWVEGQNLIPGFSAYDTTAGRKRHHSGFTGFLISTI